MGDRETAAITGFRDLRVWRLGMDLDGFMTPAVALAKQLYSLRNALQVKINEQAFGNLVPNPQLPTPNPEKEQHEQSNRKR